MRISHNALQQGCSFHQEYIEILISSEHMFTEMSISHKGSKMLLSINVDVTTKQSKQMPLKRADKLTD